jgi:hydroxymethylglutaryl-CoA lyase
MAQVKIIDVAPRDGFQAVKSFIPTGTKIEAVRHLLAANLAGIELGAFVNPRALPQMADIVAILDSVPKDYPGERRVLVPNRRGAQLALAAGATDLVFVISVSEEHNRSNVGRGVAESFADLAQLMGDISNQPIRLRLNLATSFDCPFQGKIAVEQVLAAIETALALTTNVEIGLCDTTGFALPTHVTELFDRALNRFSRSGVSFAFHGHDTYGLGITNSLAAFQTGIRVFDAAAAGIGGCPFAPGATGNVATEDLVFTFENLGISTGIDLGKLLDAADYIAAIDPISSGGHIRKAPRQRALATAPAFSGAGLA